MRWQQRRRNQNVENGQITARSSFTANGLSVFLVMTVIVGLMGGDNRLQKRARICGA